MLILNYTTFYNKNRIKHFKINNNIATILFKDSFWTLGICIFSYFTENLYTSLANQYDTKKITQTSEKTLISKHYLNLFCIISFHIFNLFSFWDNYFLILVDIIPFNDINCQDNAAFSTLWLNSHSNWTISWTYYP